MSNNFKFNDQEARRTEEIIAMENSFETRLHDMLETQKELLTLIEKLESNNDFRSIAKLIRNCFCTDHSGKMKHMWSLSTSKALNKHCIKRSKDINSICHYCYVNGLLKAYDALEKKLVRNTALLDLKVYDIECFPVIKRNHRLTRNIFRIEAFGDVTSVNVARNYIRLAKRNPGITFTAWTKLPKVWDEAFKIEGKPENLIMILSNNWINSINPMTGKYFPPEKYLEAFKAIYPWFDKIFTVYNNKAIEAGQKINCGAKSCATCQICYHKNNIAIVNEKLH